MSFKKTELVMLPTNEKATVGSIVTRPSDNRMATVNVLTINDPQPCVHQHLYFLSDEEIKEGDWFVGFADGSISPFVRQADKSTVEINNWQLNKKGTSSNKKIIATTAIICTGYSKETSKTFNDYQYLPQPSQSFIEKFVEEYNKGNVITEVMVEYEWNKTGKKIREVEIFDDVLKVNPKDNTITIRKVKDSWNRDEVVELLSKHFVDAGSKIGLGQDVTKFTKKWIQENL